MLKKEIGIYQGGMKVQIDAMDLQLKKINRCVCFGTFDVVFGLPFACKYSTRT